MEQRTSSDDELIKLSEVFWQYRRNEGYLKPVPLEFKNQAVSILERGVKANHIARYLGIPVQHLKEWRKQSDRDKLSSLQAESKNLFSEVSISESKPYISASEKSNLCLKVEKNGFKLEVHNITSKEVLLILSQV